MASLAAIAIGVAAVVAVYINWHPPEVSTRLKAWRDTDSSYFKMKGMTMFYKDATTNIPADRVLLLLHGFPTSSYDWSRIWPSLLQSFDRVIAPDFLGFGFSDKPRHHNYTIVETASFVEQLLKTLRVEWVHILAHDYGDSVAQELLARYNEGKLGVAIQSVCLTNGGIFPETNFPRLSQKIMLYPYIGPLLSRLVNQYVFGKSLSEVFGPRTQPTANDLYDFWTSYALNDGYLNAPDILRYIPERAVNANRWKEALQLTSVPIHVIYGPADLVNPPGFVPFFRWTVPQASIYVLTEYIGHYPQWEDGDALLSSYLKFLASSSQDGRLSPVS